MANEERRAAAGTSAAAGKPGPGAEERCALCVMGREAEAVLGPLLLFEACDPKKPGRWPVHSLCAQWAPQAYYSEEPGAQHSLLMVPEECRRARLLRCKVCGKAGAAVGCNITACSSTYHLPCAMLLEGAAFDCNAWAVYCPVHSDSMGSRQQAPDMATRRRRLRKLHRHLRAAAGEAEPLPINGAVTPVKAAPGRNTSTAPPSATSANPPGAASGLPPADKVAGSADKMTAGGTALPKARPKGEQRTPLEREALEPPGKRPRLGAPPAAGHSPVGLGLSLPPSKPPRSPGARVRCPASPAKANAGGGAEMSAEEFAALAVAAAATSLASLEPAPDALPPAAPATAPPSQQQTGLDSAPASLPASRDQSEGVAAAAAANQRQHREQQQELAGQQQEQQGQEQELAGQQQGAQREQQCPGSQLPLDVRLFIAEVFGAAAPAAIPAAEAYLWQEGIFGSVIHRRVGPAIVCFVDFFEHVPCTKLLFNKFFLLQAERHSAAEAKEGEAPRHGSPLEAGAS